MSIAHDGVRAMFDQADAVLFDLDGPLCDVFAGLPSAGVARTLEKVLGRPVHTNDPLEVLRVSTGSPQEIVRAVEDALISAEVEAIARSSANADGVATLRRCIEIALCRRIWGARVTVPRAIVPGVRCPGQTPP